MSENVHPLFDYDGHINTVTGIKFSLTNPKPEQINIIDICHGLAYKGHFSGLTPAYFSIAQHSLLVLKLLPDNAPKDIKLTALLHDASEAYIGDMIKPLKIHSPYFKQVEDVITHAIFNKFNLDVSLINEIKPYDKRAQIIEYEAFYKKTGTIIYLNPDDAKFRFRKTFEMIYTND